MFTIIMISLLVVAVVVIIVTMLVTPTQRKSTVHNKEVNTMSNTGYKWNEYNTDVKYDNEFIVLTLAEVELELDDKQVDELLSTERCTTATHEYRLAFDSYTELLYTKSVL